MTGVGGGMKATQEQLDAVELASKGETMKLNAFAGAGKTSTLILIANRLNELGKKGIYLAFNKSIATEAQRKMPSNVIAKTFHSLAYNESPDWLLAKLQEPQISIQDFVKEFGVIPIKVTDGSMTFSKDKNGKVTEHLTYETRVISAFKIKYLVDKALACFVDSLCDTPQKEHAKKAILSEYPLMESVDVGSFDYLCKKVTEIALKLWRDYISEDGVLGLKNNHSVYLKHWAVSKPVIDYDFILFDEAQDADGLMLSVLQSQKCQIIYVGDRHQQIYGWRGAVNAIEKIEANEGWLTQSFRFGQPLADACTPILRHLGESNTIKGFGNDTQIFNSTSSDVNAVLCRSNAGAIAKLLELVKEGKRATINLDVNESIKFIEDLAELEENTRKVDLTKANVPVYETKNGKVQYRSFEELELYLSEYSGDAETQLYYRIFKNYDVGFITSMLRQAKNQSNGIFVTTAHKSKGLEWDSVALHTDFVNHFFYTGSDGIERKIASEIDYLLPHEMNKQGINPASLIPLLKKPNSEEWRLLYVAMTRAKKRLYLGSCGHILKEYFEYYPLFDFDNQTPIMR